MMLRRLQSAAATAACLCMLAAPALAAPPAPQRLAPTDVALRDGGVLVGQLVDGQGAPLPAAMISIQSQGRPVAEAKTNDQGEFAVNGLKGGVYEIAAPGHQGAYRVWAPRTAPPAASNGVLLVSDADVVRGANPFSAVGGWMVKHPLMTAGIVAAAIAIPIALDDDDPSS